MRTDRETMEEALKRARATGGADTFGVMASLEEDDEEEQASPAELRAAIGGPAPVDAAAEPEAPALPAPDWADPVQTSAAPGSAALQARRLLGSLNTRSTPSKVPDAMRRDVSTARNQRVSDFMRAAFTRRPVQFSPTGPGEADAVRAQESSERLQSDSANRQKLAAAGLLGRLEPKPVDPSLAERRKNLSLEAGNRLKLSQAQLDALERDRVRKDELHRLELDERGKYHQGLLDAKKKPTGPHPVTAVKAGDINSVPQQYREVVKGIAEGRMEAPKAGSRFGADILKYVVAYKPDFDATKFGNYAAVSKAQATGKDVIAIDVAREHMKTAKSLIPANSDIQLINKYKQAFASGSGDPQFAPFVTASNVAAHELAKVYNIEDQAGKQMVEHMMAAAQSPQQLAAVFDTLEELIVGKQHGMERQLQRVAPTGAAPPPAPHSEAPPAGKVTPSGKPYAKKQMHPTTKRVRYLDAAGNVIEESDG